MMYMYDAGLFYYMLGNIAPQYRSVMKAVQLVAILKHSVLKSYGIDKVLLPFMDDIRALEQVSDKVLYYCYMYVTCYRIRVWTLIYMVVSTTSEVQLALFLLTTLQPGTLVATKLWHLLCASVNIVWQLLRT